jgi:hypothetical protein
MIASRYYLPALALFALCTGARADARADYYQRAAARDTAAFHALDTNQDGVVTHQEIAGDNDFGPRFNDMDINRDGVVTLEELQRYVQQHFGIAEAQAGAPPSGAAPAVAGKQP